jgi:NADPH-dependent 7-cyano-7-deazaguanine reductase QueF-like protein
MDKFTRNPPALAVGRFKGYLTSESSMERESAWDYLRSARHFTIALVSQARTAANDDDSRCTRAAAKQYLTANG